MMSMLCDDDKPREKALKTGVKSLSDAELLAILLRVGIKGKSVLGVSRDILRLNDNSLGRLSRCTALQLSKIVPGMGPVKAITVLAALELGIRARADIAESERRKPITGSRSLYDYIRAKVEDLPHEEFWVIMLSQRLIPTASVKVGQGGIASTAVDMRILFKQVLDHQCPCIALVHNHPSGTIVSSPQDDSLTRRICQAAAMLDIRVVDHIIVGHDDYYSYADNDKLK